MRTTHFLFQASAFFLSAAARQRSTNICPLLGPAFPFPRDLLSSDTFHKATASLDAALDAALRTGSTPYGDGPYNKTAFSVTLFSGFTDGLIHEYHHTPLSIAESKIGTQKIDANSIYRIASVSKLLTAYLLLIRDGEAHLNTAVAELIPELTKPSYNSTTGVLIDWDQVTVADLMTQMSGLGYNYGFDDVPPAYLKSPAFPRIPSDQVPPCNYILDNGSYVGCTRDQLIQGVATTPSLFQPGHTPVYSNVGYDVFGLALEAIAGAPVKDILEEDLVRALKLNGTSYTIPNTSKNAVIVPLDGSMAKSEWYQEFRYGNPDGGYFSSSNDMAAIGRAILTNSQISAAITNRWLKPRTFTSSPGTALAVGGPWEIFRAGSSEYVYYLYTKEGDLDTYHTMFVLVPDFNFGFTVLATGGDGDMSLPGANLVIAQIIPALEAIGRDQAEKNLGGTYRARQLESSVTFETDLHPGIKITEWISNGTDLLKILANDAEGTSVRGLDFRLFPNQLYSGDKVGFTGSMETLPVEHEPGVFSDPCQTWTGPGGTPYGKVDIGNFVFDVDTSTGEAKRVKSEALRITLERAR